MSISLKGFQTNLLLLETISTLIIKSSYKGAFRWLVDAVVQGSILGLVLAVNQLQLRWEGTYWFGLLGVDIILSAQSRCVVDGALVALDPAEQFELFLSKWATRARGSRLISPPEEGPRISIVKSGLVDEGL